MLEITRSYILERRPFCCRPPSSLRKLAQRSVEAVKVNERFESYGKGGRQTTEFVGSEDLFPFNFPLPTVLGSSFSNPESLLLSRSSPIPAMLPPFLIPPTTTFCFSPKGRRWYVRYWWRPLSACVHCHRCVCVCEPRCRSCGYKFGKCRFCRFHEQSRASLKCVHN